MNSLWYAFINPVVFAGTLRLATPILLGSLGGCFTHKAGTFFIAYESLMLTAAFFSVLGSYLSGSPVIGSLFGIISSIVMGCVFGILVFHFNGDPLVVGIALNYGAWANTTMLLKSIFGVRGSFISSKIISYKPIDIPVLNQIPILRNILNKQISIVYLAYILIFVCYVLMFRTPYGLKTRGVGINEKAAQSAGTNVLRYKWTTLLIMSVFLGLAGSYLPLSGVSMFSENMTSGRGFLCMASVLVGSGKPLKTGLIAILFGYTSALFLTLTSFELPTQLVACIPYIAVILVLLVTGLKNKRMQEQ